MAGNSRLEFPSPLKITYQRNMLIGMSVAIAISFIAILVIPQDSRDSLTYLQSFAYHNLDHKAVESPRSRTNQKVGKFLTLYNPPHEGFLGFVRLEPTHDGSAIDEIAINLKNVPTSIPDLPEFQYGLTALNDASLFYEGVSFYTMYGEDESFGLPDDKVTLIEIASAIFPDFIPKIESITESFEPPVLEFTKGVIHPRGAVMVNGAVSLEFLITEAGTIDSIAVLYEEPIAFGFSRAVKEALNEALCWPAKKDGKNISTRVRLDININWNGSNSVRMAHGIRIENFDDSP